MFFLRLALTAARSLETHFLRSLLATVGVLIGVGSVVACMAILEGASNEIVGNLSKLGSSTLYIRPAVARVEGRSVGQAQSLVIDDATLLKRELGDDIKLVSTEALGQAVVKYFQKSDTYTILATSDTYFQINEYKAAQGCSSKPTSTTNSPSSVSSARRWPKSSSAGPTRSASRSRFAIRPTALSA
jgi:macrolide transport system ATP-binding/permease protein